MLNFLHFADLHLDSPFAHDRPAVRERKREGALDLFGAVIDRIVRDEIPLCLCPGDLFDTPNPSEGTVAAVRAGFARAAGCRFVIAPGNHDPYTPDSVWATGNFSDNVIVFDSPDLTAVPLPELGCTVWGYAFVNDRPRTVCPLDGFHAEGEGAKLVVAHADLVSANSTACPITEQVIGQTGADYVALGHIHDGGVPHKIQDTVWAYSGCTAGRDFGECGKKGVLLGSIDRSRGYADCTVRFAPMDAFCYYRDQADVSGCGSDEDCARRLTELCEKNGWQGECAVRLTLTGNLSADYHPSCAAIRAMVTGPEECEIIDRTLPLADREALADDRTLRGEFFRALLPALESDDPAERTTARFALKLGLCAMDGIDPGTVELSAGEQEL